MVCVFTLAFHSGGRENTGLDDATSFVFSGRCFPCIDRLLQESSALVPGQYMPLYNPLSLADVTSALPVQDESEQVPVECHCVFVADIYLVQSNVKPFDTLPFSLCVYPCLYPLSLSHSFPSPQPEQPNSSIPSNE